MAESTPLFDIRVAKGLIFDALRPLSTALIDSAEAVEIVLPSVLENISSSLGFIGATLYTLDLEGNHLESFASSVKTSAEVEIIEIDADEPIELIAEESDKLLPEEYASNSLCLPLLLNEIPYGIICFFGGEHAVTEEIAEILKMVSEQLTLAIYTCFLEFEEAGNSEYEFITDLPSEPSQAELVSENTPHMVDFAASLQILRGVEGGGDFHDFQHLPNNKIAITIGKSSGRGEKVENVLEFIIPHIREELTTGKSLPEVLSSLNEKLIEVSERGILVSIALMILNTRTRKVQICRAGSVRMLRFKNGTLSLFEEGIGPHLGGFSGVNIKEVELQFAPSDSFAVMTDGISRLSDTENFSLDQLTHNLSSIMMDNPESQIGDQIADLLKARHTSYTPELDITVLSLQRLRKPKSISQRLFRKT